MENIQEERKQELLSNITQQINNNKIDNYKVNQIAYNDEEYKFLNNFLDDKNVEIIGIDGINIDRIDIEKKLTPQNDLPKQYNNLENEKAFERLKNGDKSARNEIIEHNLQIAIQASENYFPLLQCEKEDKAEYAKIALIEAVDGYDCKKGNRFYKYLAKCIYREIERKMLRDNQFCMHETNLKQLKQINKVEDVIMKKTGRLPSDEELCTLIPNLTLPTIKKLKQFRVMNKGENIDKVYEENEELFSMDSEFETDNIVEQKLRREDIEKALSVLNEEEREIIKDRFGLDGRKPLTYNELEKKYQYTGSGIQFKVKSCTQKIKNSKYANQLREYIIDEPITYNKKQKLRKIVEAFRLKKKEQSKKNKQEEQPYLKLSEEELCAKVAKTKNEINAKNQELMKLAARRMAIAEEKRILKDALKEYEQQYKNVRENSIEQ